MKKITLFLILLSFTISYSQNEFNSESYKVTKNDLETNIFKKDSTANAFVIYEYGNSFVDDDEFDLVFEKKKKLKILSREGFEKANITIHLYNNEGKKEKVTDIIATTHNLVNGELTRTQLTESEIFEERYNSNNTLVKFTLPDIKEGSVITYSYKITSPFIYKYKSWNFQSDIPKLYSEYNTSIPANYEYNIKLVGELKLAVNENSLKKHCVNGGNGSSADCFIAKYAIKDIPAFIDEDYMTNRDNYLSRIEYELKILKGFDGSVKNITKTWKTTDKELKTDKSIGRQFNKGGLVKNILSKKISLEKDPLKRAIKIYDFVKNNYKWNEEFKIFSDISLKKLIETKSGNVSEINFLLFNLLNENDIEVLPVLLSTRDNGLATKIYPVISDFNYVILKAKINNKEYLLDATDDYLVFGQIPFRCLNQYGRLLDFKDGSYWVDIEANDISSKQYRVEVNINEDKEVNGKINYTATNYHALSKKRARFSISNEAYIEKYQNENAHLNIVDHKVNSEKDDNKFEEEIDININAETAGDNIYFNPFLISFFETNPFKLQDRTYPIDFGYKDTYTYSMKINYDPSVFDLIETPKNIIFDLPNNEGKLIFNTKQNDGHLLIFFKFNFNNAIYNQNYYPYLKEYFNKIIQVQKNSLIVLKKK